MRPETARFIEQAETVLSRADIMLRVGLNEDAARASYLASFHVAQAYIFEASGKTSKTHRGVQSEFFRLTRDDPRIDQDLRRFLSRSYEFKSIADYFAGPSLTVSTEVAIEAVAIAKRFLAHFKPLSDRDSPDHDPGRALP